MDELQCVCDDDNIDICAISESWLNDDIPTTSVGLSGYFPPMRNDRSHKRGGGVAVYVRQGLQYRHWPELQDSAVESVWITIRSIRLPRNIPTIIVGSIYHPPLPAKDGPTNSHITRSLETILQKHPGAGIFLVGDFNRMKTSYLCKAFHLKQIVTNPTRDASILDKIFTNMSHIYGPPKVGSHLRKSDHCLVVAPQMAILCGRR